ncbi:hypothetical protein [Sandaracinus amylolyticus]|uniref:DUF8173 domain-containing protein n=1 Tax=Sandaracinus amylolyticus TaxID=927083 RepID=A0A0F6YNL5_9BACT|nr:hypothetical protein [Sandaracinus amylolyticus]AKF10597.1 hypothetical protein DB32_007746 [Sandaracinus amylolyticus]
MRSRSKACLAWLSAAIVAITLSPTLAAAQYERPDPAVGALSYFLSWAAGTFALLGLAAIAAWLVPHETAERVYRTATYETRRTLLMGLMVAVGIPLTIFALTLTILGIPLAIATSILAVPLAAAGYVTSGWLLGRALSARRHSTRELRDRVLWSLLGVGALRLIALVPLMDGLVGLVASTVGIGALIATFDRAGRTHTWRRATRAAEEEDAPRGTRIYDQAPAGA